MVWFRPGWIGLDGSWVDSDDGFGLFGIEFEVIPRWFRPTKGIPTRGRNERNTKMPAKRGRPAMKEMVFEISL